MTRKSRRIICAIIVAFFAIGCLHHLFIPFAYGDTVDQHQDNHDGNNRSFNKSQIALGELFTPTVTANITQFCINAYTSNGFTNGNFTVTIYATSSHLPTGSALTSGSLSSASFPSSVTNTNTCISLTPFSLTADTQYAAEFTSDISDGVRYYILQATSAPSPTPRANDSSLYTLDGSTWNQNTGEWFAYSESYALAPTPTPTPTPTPSPTPTPTPTPTPSPTPTPTPTPTPSPTPTPIPSTPSTSNTNSSGSPSVLPTCTNVMPLGTPNLFQITTSSRQAKLYFSPVIANVTDYVITYGYTSGDKRFAVDTHLGISSGVLSYTIDNLNPSTSYNFIIRANNGCMPGNWGNEMKITTNKARSTSHIVYYKNALVQFLSNASESLGVFGATTMMNKTCDYTVQPGDSLWSIANRTLGAGWKYQQIIVNNKDIYPDITTYSFLRPYWKLKIGC